jgi:hypothetical protein
MSDKDLQRVTACVSDIGQRWSHGWQRPSSLPAHSLNFSSIAPLMPNLLAYEVFGSFVPHIVLNA